MPRQARLDAPGVLHHVMGRGIEHQNRYKSVVCEEEIYFLELVRYLHMNPLRSKIVSDISKLDAYFYNGHSAIAGNVVRPWQDTNDVPGRFSDKRMVAIRLYRDFVEAG